MNKLLLFIFLAFSILNSYGFPSKDYDTLIKSRNSIVKSNLLNKQRKLENNFFLKSKLKHREFDINFLKKHYAFDSIPQQALNQAQEIFDKIDSLNKYVSSLIPIDTLTFPVGIKRTINNVTYIVGFSSAKFYPTYTELTAFVKITLPQQDQMGNQKEIFFGADNIKISRTGGINNEANVVLLGDFAIPINNGKEIIILKGGMDMESGNITDKTFVTIDCNGFKELSIEADIVFSRDLIQPVDVNYNIIPNQKVTGSFSTKASGWDDILASINLPPFQITKPNDSIGKGGLIFKLTNAVFDFSDTRNDPAVQFPQEYEQYLVSGNHELWKGVYIKALEVLLPKEFKKRNSSQRVKFLAQNVFIDGMGITGDFNADNILPLHEGSASKWQFSVDHFEMSFLANQITYGVFNGKIVLPVTKEISQSEANDSILVQKRSLSYDAIVDLNNDNYNLNISPVDTLSFDIFKAKANLFPNSYVQLQVANHKFKPKAVLNGNLEIAANKDPNKPDKKTLQFNGIEFQNMIIRTDSTRFSVDYLGYNGSVKLAGFPVTLSDISADVQDNTASLNFNLAVNMMSSGFSGSTSLSIVANNNEVNGLYRWQFDHVDMSDIDLHADLGSITLDGLIQIKEDDPVYGDGFYGNINANFTNIEVTASAWFGKTNYRYWYVDAFADLSSLTPQPSIGALKIQGFGGGAYYHMRKDTGSNSVVPSGLNYVPDNTKGLGFRALLGLALANEKALNGKVGFEMAFNSSGGLNRIYFFGEAHMMKVNNLHFGQAFKDKLLALEQKVNSVNIAGHNITDFVSYSKLAFPSADMTYDMGIDAFFGMEMNFQTHVFDANLEVYINSTPSVLKGSMDASTGLAGTAILHIAPDKWFLKIGTPDQRIGLRLGVGSLHVDADGYFMIGDDLPGSPPPPSEVASILGEELNQLDYMRDLNVLASGTGFATGMSLSMDTGDMTFLIFYARFQAGLGFDIMIKDYGNTACQGSGQIGIDGWYANGQAYAYLSGSLGVKVKILGYTKKAEILSGSAAVLLQAKLPNPSWFKGYVGGDYNVLGIVKGHYNFKLELGEECEVVGGAPLGGLKVISNIKPVDGADNIDVFKIPQVAFNLKINEAFEFREDQSTKTYRILLNNNDFRVSNNGNPISGHLEWNTDKNIVNFVSDEVLPANSPIHIYVRVTFQRKDGQSWHTLQTNGHDAEEIEQITFTTGDAPDYIPVSNIKYCYPVIDQQYYYKNERQTGYVKLKQGQSYLFPPNTDWTQKIDVEDSNGIITTAQNVSYDSIARTVHFDIPQNLTNQEDYSLKIISVSPQSGQSQYNTDDNYQTGDLGYTDNTIETRNRQAQDVEKEAEETEILVIPFTTSQYNTFAEKINAKILTNGYSETLVPNVEALYAKVENTEAFSKTEILGNEFTENKSLIQLTAVLDDAYYTNTIYPKIYHNYPLQGQFTVARDTTLVGLPPVRALPVYGLYIDDLENYPNSSFLKNRMPFKYNLPYYYHRDRYDIVYKIINSNSSQNYDYIVTWVFERIYSGYYKVRYQYRLPGDIPGSSAIFNYQRL